MKKLLLSLALLASNAIAEPTVILARGIITNQSGPSAGTESDSTSIKLIQRVQGAVSADLLFVQNRNQSTNVNSMQYEIGIIQGLPINSYFTSYIRPSIGSIQPNGSGSMNYVGIEPGLIVRPWAGKFSIKTDYSWFTGLNTSALDVTMARVAMAYDISKTSSVGIRKDVLRGDMASETSWVNYTHRF